VIIGPSNPLISVDPFSKLFGSHSARSHSGITPIVAGSALKGRQSR